MESFLDGVLTNHRIRRFRQALLLRSRNRAFLSSDHFNVRPVTIIKRYLFSAIVAVAIVTCTVYFWNPFAQRGNRRIPEVARVKIPEEDDSIIIKGRALVVVVEDRGAYVGETLIAFDIFDGWLRKEVAALGPDCIIVYGTDKVNYGKVVRIYDLSRKELGDNVFLQTLPITVGTRFEESYIGPLFLNHRNKPNQSLEPTLASGTSPAGQEPRLP